MYQNFLLWLNHSLLYVYNTSCLSIHLLMDMSHSHILCIILVYKYLFEFLFSIWGYTSIPRSRHCGLYDSSMFSFWGATKLFSMEATPFSILTSNSHGSQLLYILTNTCHMMIIITILVSVRLHFIVVLICISIPTDIEHLLVCFLAIFSCDFWPYIFSG